MDLISKLWAQTEAYKTAKRAISLDQSLSEKGKRDSLAKLKAKATAEIEAAGLAMFAGVEAAVRDADRQTRAANAAAAAGWDFARLAWGVEQARSLLAGVTTVGEIEALATQLEASGDSHLFRAFVTLAPSVLAAMPLDSRSVKGGLLASLKADAQKYTETPATLAAQAAASTAIDGAIAAKNAAEAALAELGIAGGGLLAAPAYSQSALEQWVGRIAVSKHYDSAKQQMRTTVEILPPPTQPDFLSDKGAKAQAGAPAPAAGAGEPGGQA